MFEYWVEIRFRLRFEYWVEIRFRIRFAYWVRFRFGLRFEYWIKIRFRVRFEYWVKIRFRVRFEYWVKIRFRVSTVQYYPVLSLWLSGLVNAGWPHDLCTMYYLGESCTHLPGHTVLGALCTTVKVFEPSNIIVLSLAWWLEWAGTGCLWL